MNRAAAALAARFSLVLATACAGDPDARDGEATRRPADTARPPATSPAKLLADSAAGDSAAFDALPASLRAAFDVRDLLAPAALADTARALCVPQGAASEPDERRRLRFRRPDTVGVLFVRAERRTGELRRVELVRRPLTGGPQQGFIWDASDDVTREVNWVADSPDAVETGPLPRGGPAPRALRGLGRLLLVAPCGPAAGG